MFGNIITAIVTPFDKTNNINLKTLKKLINHLISNKSSTILLSGTTGEGMCLSSIEKQVLIEKSLEYIDHRVKVIMNVGTNCTDETIDNIKRLEKYDIDGYLVVVPYYNKPPQEGIYRHFKAIAESTKKPIIIYNVPKRTASNIDGETIVKLSQINNIVGIKEASGDLERIQYLMKHTEDFLVYTGDDTLLYDAIKSGADGVVSVASHIYGDSINTIIQLIKAKEYDDAKALFNLYKNKFESLFKKTNPIAIKAALNELNFDVGSVRLPLIELNGCEKIQLFKELGL